MTRIGLSSAVILAMAVVVAGCDGRTVDPSGSPDTPDETTTTTDGGSPPPQADAAPPLPTPTPSTFSGSVQRVATNADGSCALMTDGTVKCWGMFVYVEEPPHAIAGLSKVTEIALAAEHACALLEDQTVQCWGRNSCYQLGSERAPDFVTPVRISGLDKVVHISANALGARTLALREDGRMWQWGTGYDWLGGCTAGATAQTGIEGPEGIVDTAGAGGERFVALKGDGSFLTWAEEATQQTGSLPNVAQLSSGGSCAVLTDGTVRCWDPAAPASPAQPLAGLANVLSMTGGAAAGCAVLADHTARCWGPNDKGQVGDGTTTDRPTPTPVAGLANVASVSMSSTHACALLLDGSVMCWGVNTEGQLGDGTHTERHAPVSVVW